MNEQPADVATCRVCGCTEGTPCPGGCWWVPDPAMTGDLCSACAGSSSVAQDVAPACGNDSVGLVIHDPATGWLAALLLAYRAGTEATT
jgi:hypothetical protein